MIVNKHINQICHLGLCIYYRGFILESIICTQAQWKPQYSKVCKKIRKLLSVMVGNLVPIGSKCSVHIGNFLLVWRILVCIYHRKYKWIMGQNGGNRVSDVTLLVVETKLRFIETQRNIEQISLTVVNENLCTWVKWSTQLKLIPAFIRWSNEEYYHFPPLDGMWVLYKATPLPPLLNC